RLRQQPQVSRFVMRDESGRAEKGDANVAGDQIVDRLAGAAIGNVVKLDVRHLREPPPTARADSNPRPRSHSPARAVASPSRSILRPSSPRARDERPAPAAGAPVV